MTKEKKSFLHPPGFPDITPEDHVYYTFVKKVVRHRCRQSGYRRITPSLLEDSQLFEEIFDLNKEDCSHFLYSIENQKKSYQLHPQLTPSILRAYVENEYKKLPQPVELYGIESVYKKAKQGKNEEVLNCFTQFDVEIIGEADCAMDAQLVYLAQKILKDLGVSNRFTLQINNLGSEKSQQKFNEELKNFYYGKEHVLGEEGKLLLKTNPKSLLISEDEDLKILAQLAPKVESCLDKESKNYFQNLCEYLDELGVKYEINPFLMGDRPYYTNSIFAFVDQKTQKNVLVGGRYNNLIEKIGGGSVPALGFYANFEDLIEIMKDENIYIKDKDTVDVFVAQLGAEAKKKCMSIMMKLREIGVHTIGALGKGSMKDQLALAEKFGASWTIIMGQIEVLEGIAILRNMQAGSQEIVRYDDLSEEIINRIGEDNLDRYSVGVEETVYKDDEEIVGEEYEELMGGG